MPRTGLHLLHRLQLLQLQLLLHPRIVLRLLRGPGLFPGLFPGLRRHGDLLRGRRLPAPARP
ncbi:hypothetical protein SF23_11120, partial [Streptomyces sp. MBRL 10]